ncbi:ExbD/TolR family protein [Craterilacuibacter sp.]|uniref:ExbD/TolR family protein n=1 Tax=Craterilacuibacter sp. TaxID=2870909 RepID=UPI003F2B974D
MNFRRGRHREEPEINFIPLIDLLLVILIFLMVTTTYSRYSEIEINLPSAEAGVAQEKASELDVLVSAAGEVVVGKTRLANPSVEALAEVLKLDAQGRKDPVVVISADARAQHQAVVSVMEAARAAGLTQLTFATRSEGP